MNILAGSTPVRGHSRRVVAVAVAAVCLAATLSMAASARPVRVGIYQNQPKVFVSAGGGGAGFFIDLLSEVAIREGWDIRQVPCDWADCLNALNDGRIDIMPDVAWSAERAARFDFHPTPVIESWSQVYAAPGLGLDSLLGLDGLRVAVLRGSIQQVTFETLVNGLGVKPVMVPVDSLEEAFLTVKGRRADAALANHFFGDYFSKSYGLEKTAVVFQPVNVHFAVGKGRNADLLGVLEKFISAQRSTPNSAYYRALSRWMTGPRPGPVLPWYILWIFAGVLALLAVTIGISALLRHQVRVKTAHLAQANQELARTHGALMKSEALLNMTQQMASVGGWEYDVQAGKMNWTAETFRIHGFMPGDSQDGAVDLIERSLELYDQADRQIVRDALARCVADGTPYDIEASFKSLRGDDLVIRTTGLAIRDDSGKVVRVVGTFMDITRMKREQQARARAEDELRIARRLETMGRLTGGIAHDFNNLLAAIRGYSDLILRRADLPEVVRNDILQIQQAGESAANLTHQLLAFGSRGMLQPRVVSMNSVVTGLEKMLRRLLRENIEIVVRLAGDSGTTMADRGQLEQVVINLVINARDAMPAGGRLVIGTARMDNQARESFGGVDIEPGHWLVLTVSDTGCGMDRKTLARIFEPFFTTKDVGRGTGLGLATVFSIVSQAGGRVGVSSQPGRGSEFRVFLPRLDEPEFDASVEKSSGFTMGSGTILLVDDDAGVRTVAERILVDAGYRVLSTDDGNEALNLCQRHSQEIDLLLTDLIVPGIRGAELAGLVTRRYPEIRIAFMSGYMESSGDENPLPDIDCNLISKPFTADELTATVHRVLTAGVD